MKILFLILVFVLPIAIYSQTEDFPILDKNSNNLTLPIKIANQKSKIVLPLSSEYFFQKFSVGDYNLRFNFSADTNFVRPFKRNEFDLGGLRILGSQTTLSKFNFLLAKNFGNGLFNFSANSEIVGAYLPNANEINFGLNASGRFFTNHDAELLDRSFIGFSAGTNFEKFNFWNSITPKNSRDAISGFSEFQFYNIQPNSSLFDLRLKFGSLFYKSNDFREYNFNGKLFSDYKIGVFSFVLAANGNYQKLDNTNYTSAIYINAKPELLITPKSFFEIALGSFISYGQSEIFLHPTFRAKVFMVKNLVGSVSWSSETQFINHEKLYSQNKYYNKEGIENFIQKEFSKVELNVNYSYKDLLNVSLKTSYSNFENYFYFEEISRNGYFDVQTAPKIRSISAEFNGEFFKSEYGFLLLKGKYQSVKDTTWHKIPFIPMFEVNSSYNQNFTEINLFGQLGIEYSSRVYTNFANTSLVTPNINMFAKAEWKFLNNWKFLAEANNLLNRENWYYSNYRLRKLDILVGIEYLWR